MFSTLITGCVAIPIPDSEETVVHGQAFTENDVPTKIVIGEDLREVQARLGEPDFDFGPGRVLVYIWTVRYGNIFWFLGGGGVATIPWTNSHLLIVAFHPDGKALKAGTMDFYPFDSMAEHVRKWLVSNDLASQVAGPRVGVSTHGGPELFIYRPSSSPCPFPTFDSNWFKPSIAIDGKVVGDVLKGEYLGVDITVGAHVIKIDPAPAYRGKGGADHIIPASVSFSGDLDRPTYIETYLCTGKGDLEAHATVRDEPTALKELRDSAPAW
jgi:hypothetical protein